MKKPNRKSTLASRPASADKDDILPEYDFSQGRRNHYAGRIATDAVVVVLEPDVAKVFPDAGAVNDALRALAKIAQKRPARSRSKRRTA